MRHLVAASLARPAILATVGAIIALGSTPPQVALAQGGTQRDLEVADLFALESVGVIRWNASGTHAAFEVRTAGNDLNPRQAGNHMHVWGTDSERVIDLNDLAADRASWGGVWAPDGNTLALLVAGPDAAVNLAIWSPERGLREVADVDVRLGLGGASLHWIDNESVIVTAWPDDGERSGSLFQLRTRGQRLAALHGLRRSGAEASASVLDTTDSFGVYPAPVPTALVRYDVHTGGTEVVHEGLVHRLSIAPGGRHAAYFTPSPGIPSETVDSFLEHEELYSSVNWGTAVAIVDLADGNVVGAPLVLRDPAYGSIRWSESGNRMAVRGTDPNDADKPGLARWSGGDLDFADEGDPTDAAAVASWLGLEAPVDAVRPDPLPLPSSSAVSAVASIAPSGITLYRERGAEGDRLLAVRPAAAGASTDPEVLWTGNAWLPEISLPRTQRVDYETASGDELTGWLLLPPGDGPFPTIVNIYPGTVHGEQPPRDFTRVTSSFTSPLLFAARGFAVLVPSAPEGDYFTGNLIDEVVAGVLPAVDAAIATGLVDADRLVVQGQSGGGYATLGLIGKTDRFKGAIASASYSDLESLYGTFYGQMRDGEGGHPQRGQVLRISQMERGFMRMGGPPWELPERYRDNSPITYAGAITTPLLLIHGDLDFIPIQQAEQMFTSLYRRGRDVRFLRYYGEWHTISGRANVEHMWREIDRWLRLRVTD